MEGGGPRSTRVPVLPMKEKHWDSMVGGDTDTEGLVGVPVQTMRKN